MKVKIRKLRSHLDGFHPNNIEEGYEIDGEFMESPRVGYPFWVGKHWRTSPVTKILSDNTFKTVNSTYEWSLIKTT
jgi:hypothetical protein